MIKQADPSVAAAILRGVVHHWKEFGPDHGLGEMLDYADRYLRGDGAPMEPVVPTEVQKFLPIFEALGVDPALLQAVFINPTTPHGCDPPDYVEVKMFLCRKCGTVRPPMCDQPQCFKDAVIGTKFCEQHKCEHYVRTVPGRAVAFVDESGRCLKCGASIEQPLQATVSAEPHGS